MQMARVIQEEKGIGYTGYLISKIKTDVPMDYIIHVLASKKEVDKKIEMIIDMETMIY